LKKLFIVLCSTALCLLLSCSRIDQLALRVVSPLPHGIVQRDAPLVFEFSRGVVTTEVINQWTTTPYIEFSPAIPGMFVWQDSARLVFSPDGMFPGDIRIKAKLNVPLLLKSSGAPDFDGDDEFTIATEPFTLSRAEFFYDRIEHSRTVGVRMNLEFTYAVQPADVRKHLAVSIDNTTHDAFTVMAQNPSKIIPVEIGNISQLEKKRTFSIAFSKEFTSSETNTPISMAKPFEYILPGLEELKIYGHNFNFNGTESTVEFKTSQEVDAEAAGRFVTVVPERRYVIETKGREGFILRGNFEPGTAFTFLVKKDLPSLLGAKTRNDYQAAIIIGNVQPSYRFTSQGMYLMLSGAQKIGIATVNVSQLRVRVSQVFQNNIVHFLHNGRSYDYDYYYDDTDDGFSSYRRKYRFYIGNYGRFIEEKIVDISSAPNREVISEFVLKPFLKSDYKGFYLVEISNKEGESWRSTAKLISLSDIGLIVKRGNAGVNVFAVSLESNKPMQNVKVDLISSTNQQIASAMTDGEGLASFAYDAEQKRDFELMLVAAAKNDDANIINLRDYRVETSRFDVAGKRDVAGMFDAFVYGDRTLYRPGEKMIITGIVRNLHNILPKGLPIKVRIFNPRGNKIAEVMRSLNEEGSFEYQHQTLPAAMTGNYRVEILTGDEQYLATYQVILEDFVPDRLKIFLTASKDKAVPGEKVVYHAEALNFFGPPASGRSFEFEGTFVPVPYISKKFPDLRFNDDGAPLLKTDPIVVTGETDGNGKAEATIVIPQAMTAGGLMKARGRIAVFDESGRPVYRVVNTTVYPKRYYIGVRNKGAYYVSPNVPQAVSVVAVDQDDVPIDGFEATVSIIRKEWHSVLRTNGRGKNLRYVSEQREIPVQSFDVILKKDPIDVQYSVSRSGDYVVRISKKGEDGYNAFSFYSYSWGTTDVTSFEQDPEARIDIVFDKKIYHPGDDALVLFQAPFDGTMLVTVERNGVYSSEFIPVKNNAASLRIPVKDKYLPNVYVSAVLFRKLKDQNLPLLAGHGFAPLMVERLSDKLNVVITAPEKIRPKRKQEVKVKVYDAPRAIVTLAAVDEGILQIKNYATPDPYGYFYARKALETETFDFFRDLIPEPVPQKSSTGGSDDEIAARANPLAVSRFKPVSLWSGVLTTDAEGEATVLLDVPDFNGELRLMAVAYKGDRFGSAQKPMTVADPVVITPALPRFIAPNDIIVMPVTAFNTTEKPTTLSFAIQTEGPVTVEQKTVTMEIGANQERFINVTLKATNEVGKAKVSVSTSAFGEQIETETEISVRPISPFATVSTVGFLDGGGTTTLSVDGEFYPFNRKQYLILSPFPVANFAIQLKHLVGYPHGCLEQTTSKAFPQIYLRDIATVMDPSILNNGSPTYFVNEAIAKITSMQQPDGYFSYWPGEYSKNHWAMVYATHFLFESKKAGYVVSDAVLNSALGVLQSIAREKSTVDYYVHENNRVIVKRIADKSSIYALYVLALAGKADIGTMNFFRTARHLLTDDTRSLLAGAYILNGDKEVYNELMPAEFTVEQPKRMSGGWFDSPIRSAAVMLNVLIESDPNNQNIIRYVDYLSRSFETSRWFSTQENAFTLLGLGKLARLTRSQSVQGSFTVNGVTTRYDGGNKQFDLTDKSGDVSLSLMDGGRVYYSFVTEGIRKDGGTKPEDRNLRVRREFFDRFGGPVNLESVKQNSLVIVKITVTCADDILNYVAVSDLLPAGFEIENPRLQENSEYSIIRNPSTPEYADIRDDRINFYTSFKYREREKKFYYLVRAVTKGEFVYPPISAEAMYDGNYVSLTGKGLLKVVE
jgi:hypothetical protein